MKIGCRKGTADASSVTVGSPGRDLRRFGLFLAGGAAGALAGYVLDPAVGRWRRRLARDRGAAIVRRASRRGASALRTAARRSYGHMRGQLHALLPGRVSDLDDAELAHKVESIVFRDTRIPKGALSINAESGRVFVRGEVEDDALIEVVMEAVRRVKGVEEVENLMHLPGTPAPSSQGGALLHRS